MCCIFQPDILGQFRKELAECMGTKMTKVDVIIPVYRPDETFLMLLERLCCQTVEVNRIIIMNTEEKYFHRLTYGTKFVEKYRDKALIYHLSKREFDHGATRHRGVLKSDADIFVMMTDDALPADAHLLENLLEALKEDEVAVAYARQLPAKDCSPEERYARKFNYPEVGHIRSIRDLGEKGIKTYFCSNVCAAYKRKVYDEAGGFVRKAIFNEDMLYAAQVMEKGWKVAYAAEAKVIHSHNYTNKQQFQRNFDLGVSQAQHPEVFSGVRSEAEGKKMVLEVTDYLKRSGKWFRIPGFYMQTISKYCGYLLGKKYRYLPGKLIQKCTMNPTYWQRE